MEEPALHIQASASSSSRVCTALATINHCTHTILLDTGSSISSISTALVHRLGLPTSTAPSIQVLFGDHQHLYHSHTQAHCTFTLGTITFSHHFYVLPHQLFPLTLGCDWFLKRRAVIDFDAHKLLVPHASPIPLLQDSSPSPHLSQVQVALSPQERLVSIRQLLARFPSLTLQPTHAPTVSFPVQHAIRTGEATPIRMATRRRSPLDHDRIDAAVTDMLTKGIIVPSTSDWVSEPHLVKKDDGTFRFCIDFRPLNKVTIHDLYPLPRVDDLLDQIGGSRYFTSLDLASGYWQIPLKPSDAHKTAFRTRRGLFQFTRMPFGLSDAGSTFQRMANSIFAALINKGVLLVYLDDILIHTATWEDHLQALAEVLACITKHNLQLQWKKCRWGSTSLRFLGFIISGDGIRMDPAKVAAINDYPRPTSVKSLQRFLGMITFSLRFIPNLALVTFPLRQLLKKGVSFSWDPACEDSFRRLKTMVKESGLLAHPNFDRPFTLQTDASNQGLGAVLLQADCHGQEKAVAFISRTLTPAERNYSTTEKELLAIVWSFQRFHPYLHGGQVTVETDHQPLLSLIHRPHPPGRLLRWTLALQEYQFTLSYRKGATNLVADSLSRADCQAVQFLPETSDLPIPLPQLATLQQHDPAIQQIIHQLRSLQPFPSQRRFMLRDNLVFFIQAHHEPRLYIPHALQQTYLQFYHDHPLSGHLGFHKVLEKLRLKYYWPNMRHSVSTYINQCALCQHIKPASKPAGTLQPITVTSPFELVGWDFMGPFPETPNGNKYILVITEYLTRWAETVAIPDVTAPTIASQLLHKVIFQHGCPVQLLSDQGRQFHGDVLNAVATQLGVQQVFTSPYHPQTNGLTERLNKTLKQEIAAYIDPCHKTWDQILPFVTHAYNTSVQA